MPDASPVSVRARVNVARRIIPFVMLLYIDAFLDRVNVAYAGLDMMRDLHFNEKIFGFGAGIFFLGYLAFGVPGAMSVGRWSARKWIAVFLVTWGCVTMLTNLVKTPTEFYCIRFLLGVAEAGFFPGLIVYLGRWFTKQDRAKAMAGLLMSIPVASIVGSPIAGLLLQVHAMGLAGWRWLFILEGLPAILLGGVTLFYLTDRPEEAHWLPEDEREWLVTTLKEEKQPKNAEPVRQPVNAAYMLKVVTLGSIYMFGDIGLYGFTIWFPTILKMVSGYSMTVVTLVGVIPYTLAFFADLFNGWHSDKTGERRWHTALPLFLGAIFLFLGLAFHPPLMLQLLLFCVLAACIHCWQPSFWALPTAVLGESAAAASIGVINSIGHVGAFTGPFLIGYLKTEYKSFYPGLAALLFGLCAAGVLALSLKADSSRREVESEMLGNVRRPATEA